MDQGGAIDLAGRGLKDRRPQTLGEAEHVDRAMHAGLGGLHRIALVVDRGGRAGQIEDRVNLDVERERHVVPDRLEHRV
jgi:hypothetical protein